MNNFSTNKENLSTPERKRNYIQSWLEDSPFVDTSLSINFDREVTPEPTEQCSSSIPTSSSKLEQNQFTSTHIISPVLGGKRMASSPIIGSLRKKLKRIKLPKTSIKYTKETKHVDRQVDAGINCDKTLVIENNDETQLNINNVDNLKKSFYDSTLSLESEKIINESSPLKNTDITSEVCKIPEQYSSQILDSELSQEKSLKSSEAIVQEIDSESDKTPSDLIEDISTQLTFNTPQQISHKQFQQLSQVISDPASDSSKDSVTEEIQGLESTSTQPNVNFHSLEPLEADIQSPSTLNTKLSLSKTSYLLQYTSDNEKRKKKPKKGSLLDSLLTAMAKEKSSINLVRHQLKRKLINMEDKPFILLKIIQHLPMMNENQLVSCKLVEDRMNLLQELIGNKRDFLITIINVPAISSKINTSLKPLLKVYQPWTILDSNQLLLHISRFIAVPTDSTEESDVNRGSCKDKYINTMHTFNCPCINRNALSAECKFRFQDGIYDVTKIIFDDKS